jgi:hypothetical protein
LHSSLLNDSIAMMAPLSSDARLCWYLSTFRIVFFKSVVLVNPSFSVIRQDKRQEGEVIQEAQEREIPKLIEHGVAFLFGAISDETARFVADSPQQSTVLKRTNQVAGDAPGITSGALPILPDRHLRT